MPPAKGPKKTWIGFYGCSRTLVRVATRTASRKAGHFGWRPRNKFHVTCPACGHEHSIQPMWRKPNSPTEVEKADIEVKG